MQNVLLEEIFSGDETKSLDKYYSLSLISLINLTNLHRSAGLFLHRHNLIWLIVKSLLKDIEKYESVIYLILLLVSNTVISKEVFNNNKSTMIDLLYMVK